MTFEHVFRVLAKVDVDGELTIDCPSGGRLTVDGATERGRLIVDASDEAALWDLTRLVTRFGPAPGFRSLRYLRNPLLQPLDIRIANRKLLRWNPGKTPGVESLSGLLRFLRSA